MKKLHNIAVSISPGGGSRYNCAFKIEGDDCRYHVWLTPEGQLAPSSLRASAAFRIYKNPPAGTEYRERGYFPTRHLNAASATWAPVVKRLLARVEADGLLQRAREDHERLIRDEATRQAAERRERARASLEGIRMALIEAGNPSAAAHISRATGLMGDGDIDAISGFLSTRIRS